MKPHTSDTALVSCVKNWDWFGGGRLFRCHQRKDANWSGSQPGPPSSGSFARSIAPFLLSFAIVGTTFAWPTLPMNNFEALSFTNSDIVFSSFDGKVHVSVPTNGAGFANTLSAIDPFTGAIGPSIPVGLNPSKLAASHDGRYIYVVAGNGNQIDRVDLVANAVSLSFSLGNAGGGLAMATDVAVMPGQPTTIAVACGDGGGPQEVRIYDHATVRPQKIAISGVTTLRFGADSATLYGYDAWTTSRGFYTLAVDAGGVTQISYLDFSPFERGADLAYADGFLFGTSRGIFDPASSLMSFPFHGSSGFAYHAPLAVDAAARRVCYVLPKGSNNENFRLQLFDLDTYLPVGELSLPSPPGYFTGKLIRWGADGLVYRANTNQLLFSRTDYLPSSPPTDLCVWQNFTPAGLSNAYLLCSVANLGTNPAPFSRLKVQFEGGVALGGATTSIGSVQVTNAQVVCDFGVLPSRSTNTVGITFLQSPSNTVVATAIASSISRDTNSGNNSAMLLLSTPSPAGTGVVFSVTLPLVDLVADPIGGGLFLAVDRQVPNLGNGLVHFDPASGMFSHSTFVGKDLRKVGRSSDGQFLYAVSAGRLSRFVATNLASRGDFNLMQNYSASDISVFSDDCNRVALWHVTQPDRHGSVFSIGLGYYENGVLLGATNLGTTGRFRQVDAAGTNVGIRVFDSWNGLEVLSFRWDGGALTNDLAVYHPYLYYQGRIAAVGNLLFSPYGRVYEVGAGRVLGNFNVPGWDDSVPAVEPDLQNARVFFLRPSATGMQLHSFDSERFRIIQSVVLPGVGATPSRLIRCGEEGFAFFAEKLFIVRSELVPRGPEADLTVHLTGGANPGGHGQTESYTVTITNFGPNMTTAIGATVSFSLDGMISVTSTSQGSTTVSNRLVSWNIGSLPAGTSASAELTFTPWTGGLLQVAASVSGDCRDRHPSNDYSVHLEVVTNGAWLARVTELPLPAKDVITDPSRSNLLVSLHELGGLIGNCVLKLNPRSGQVVGPVFVGSSPNQLALSSDGSQLFVGLDGASAVRELDAVSLQPLATFPISNGLRADCIGVVPGTSQTLVIYQGNAGLSVFDQGIELSNRLVNVSTFAFDDVSGDLYGYDRNTSGPLYRLAWDASGVTIAQTLPSALRQSGVDFKSANGLFFYDRGLAVSPTVAAEAGHFPVSQFDARVQPALDQNWVCFLTGISGKWSMRGFHAASAQPMGMQMLPALRGTPGRLARFGNSGLAFATSTNQFFLLRNLFSTEDTAADLAIHKLSAPRTALPGKPARYSCVITNHSLQPAAMTVVTQAYGFTGSIQSVQTISGTVQTNGTVLTWSVGELGGNASAELSVELLPTVAQTITNETTVGSMVHDPTLANNSALAFNSVRDFNTNLLVTIFNLPAADLVYDASTQLLWAAVTNSQVGGVLVPIDPIEGVVGPGLEVGSEVTRIAVAGDGVHLYGLLPAAAGVIGVNTADARSNFFTSVGFKPTADFFRLLDLSICPTNPLHFAVSYHLASSSQSNFVALVRAGLLMPSLGRYSAHADALEYDELGDQLYGFNNTTSGFQLSTFSVISNGVAYKTNQAGAIAGFGADIERGTGRLFGSAGQVVDPRSRAVITNLSSIMTATAVEPVPTDNRLYFATKTPYSVRIFNLTNFARLQTNTLAGVSGDIRSLVRWGADGLAMHTASGQIVLLRSSGIPSPPGLDSDADGMPDGWESLHGLNPYDASDASLDLDGDGLGNHSEFLAGTNPYSVASTFRIKRVSLQSTNLVIVFGSATGRTYSIDSSGELDDINNWTTILTGIPGTGGDLTNSIPISGRNQLIRLRTHP